MVRNVLRTQRKLFKFTWKQFQSHTAINTNLWQQHYIVWLCSVVIARNLNSKLNAIEKNVYETAINGYGYRIRYQTISDGVLRRNGMCTIDLYLNFISNERNNTKIIILIFRGKNIFFLNFMSLLLLLSLLLIKSLPFETLRFTQFTNNFLYSPSISFIYFYFKFKIECATAK